MMCEIANYKCISKSLNLQAGRAKIVLNKQLMPIYPAMGASSRNSLYRQANSIWQTHLLNISTATVRQFALSRFFLNAL